MDAAPLEILPVVEEGQDVSKDSQDQPPSTSPLNPCWTKCTDALHQGIISVVLTLSLFAVRRPWTVVLSVSFLSLLLVAVGLFTNFVFVSDPEEFLIPFGAEIENQYDWIVDTFPDAQDIHLTVVLHEQGNNVLTVNTARKALEFMDELRAVEGYNQVCQQGDHVDIYGERTCWVYTVGRFWDHNLTYYDATVKTDQDVMEQVSPLQFPYGDTPVAHDAIIGNYERVDDTATGTITFAQSYVINVILPFRAEGVVELELALIDTCLRLRDEWSQLEDPVYLEFLSDASFAVEVGRAVLQDIPILPIVFIIMCNFCSVVFWQKHKVKSRWLLGYGAVITVACSIFTGFGILFIAGVPVTTMLLGLPCIIFGIGLDDTFIITGAFFRTNDKSSIEERVTKTMKEIGLSITLTTLTTTIAFLLCSMSTIRAIRWVGWYAFLTIMVDALYQVTFYVALLVLDERRIQDNRRDVCFWIVVPRKTTTGGECGESKKEKCTEDSSTASNQKDSEATSQQKDSVGDQEELEETTPDSNPQQDLDPNESNFHFADRFMIWYARKLVPKRSFQVIVWAVFLSYFAVCCHRTTLLRQGSETEDFMPDDSYVPDFLDSVDSYLSFNQTSTHAYFRNVNQADPEIQEQMRSFMEEMRALEHVGTSDKPEFCWVNDFPKYQLLYADQFGNMTFNEMIAAALAIPAIDEIYGSDIVLDDSTGEIIASRCLIRVNGLDTGNSAAHVEFYHDQEEVASAQPVNDGRKEIAFFSFHYIYFAWDFFAAISRELTASTIIGIVTVSFIGFLFIPHWSGVFFVFPLICILYIDLLGTIQLMGLKIDSMVFVCIILSVGLLVDHLMHALLRYYETPGSSRMEKVQATLVTMGSSIFVGGLSTFLSIMPLVFSSSMVMRTIFLFFLAMVTVGILHGLVFLPVVLCLLGPLNKPSHCEQQDSASSPTKTQVTISLPGSPPVRTKVIFTSENGCADEGIELHA